MAQQSGFSRRGLLKMGGLGVVGLGAGSLMANNLAAVCGLTPKQPEGPFYPIADQPDKNTDLTLVDGKTRMASGQLIYLSGKVTDQHCVAVKKAVVEIWQACASGRYNHPGDEENPSPLDENFQYWGIAATNDEGLYSFKTIIPGHYEAGPGWIRPPHVHYKVHKRGYRELITQMYFTGNIYNEGDRILREIPKSDWPSVVRDLSPLPSENDRATFAVSFDISLVKL
jgi:protocatechuate 3,4-dioxygenase beta subunit